ncbi:RcnB family protein [Sphingomonas sp. G-3-2-10]|uniref:RcnB family protein n=1 Tax=Sphingomonas sp. G-3-2-10 TaxID=2728838 RepID=UPI00146D0665|nr:RcnB family protein [Sphingomonas sp. G-3-2-10]NML07220.1 RcnB family protein [Sphingomonas sp. G-3-2-10]
MKKFITAALLAAVAMPVAIPAAQAQSREQRRDYRDDRRDYRQDRRDDRRDYRNDRRNDRRDYRDDRRDRRWGDDDWRGWRNSNRGLYSRGNWRAPFRYNSFRPGVSIGVSFYGPRYRISDPWRYRLPQPGYNQAWVRHYDDLLLVDTRRGRVIRVIRGFYW